LIENIFVIFQVLEPAGDEDVVQDDNVNFSTVTI